MPKFIKLKNPVHRKTQFIDKLRFNINWKTRFFDKTEKQRGFCFFLIDFAPKDYAGKMGGCGRRRYRRSWPRNRAGQGRWALGVSAQIRPAVQCRPCHIQIYQAIRAVPTRAAGWLGTVADSLTSVKWRSRIARTPGGKRTQSKLVIIYCNTHFQSCFSSM